MKAKKILSVIMSAILAVGMTACNGGEKTTDNGEVPTLTWLVPGNAQADLQLVMDEANKIIEPAIGAKLEMRIIDNASYTEKMNMSFSAGEVFDICFTGYINPFDTTAKKGAYYPLDELLETTPDLKASIPEWLWDVPKMDGTIYAVPNYQTCANWMVPFVQTSLVEELDLDLSAVKTIEDLEPIMEKIHAAHPEMYTVRAGNLIIAMTNDKETYGYGILANAETLDADNILYDRNSYYWQAADLMNDWYEKGYIRKDVESAGDDNIDLTNGKYAIFCNTYKPGVEAEMKSRYGREYTPILIGSPIVKRSSCNAALTAISRTSKNPEKAIKLLELVNTNKELFNIICYGIEGKHYEWVDDTHIKLDENSGYYVNASWRYGNQFNAYLLEGMDAEVWAATEELNNTATKSPFLGFTFDTDTVTSEFAQLAAVSGEYTGSINTGARAVDSYYDEYVERMKAAGIERLHEEVQKQLDEYKKTK